MRDTSTKVQDREREIAVLALEIEHADEVVLTRTPLCDEGGSRVIGVVTEARFVRYFAEPKPALRVADGE